MAERFVGGGCRRNEEQHGATVAPDGERPGSDVYLRIGYSREDGRVAAFSKGNEAVGGGAGGGWRMGLCPGAGCR